MRIGIRIIFLAGVFLCGLLAAWAAAWAGGMRPGWYLLPFAVCVDGFVFSSVCFFLTSDNKEILYGVCSAACAACAIVQLGILL